MLCLSRKKGEKIIVGSGLVTITVVEIKGSVVRIGIEAPKELSVHREEIQVLRDKVSKEGGTTCQQ
jgi:carbon storage regulator